MNEQFDGWMRSSHRSVATCNDCHAPHDLIGDIRAARANGVSSNQLETAREMQRRSQFYLDFVEAENSTGFHAPQEATRILGEALDYARQGQIALLNPDFTPRIAPPSRGDGGG